MGRRTFFPVWTRVRISNASSMVPKRREESDPSVSFMKMSFRVKK